MNVSPASSTATSTTAPPSALPDDPRATLVGRVFDPDVGGPSVVVVRDEQVHDLSDHAATMADLLERPDLLELVRCAQTQRSWSLPDVLANTLARTRGTERDDQRVRFLAPIDLQVIKAAGVTFALSMVERVIEERAAGDAALAEAVRARINEAVGGAISGVRPGSSQAESVKQILISEGLWSQYLEVGIGPDPEIFTKAPVLSAVGLGDPVGVLSRSTWNNPEPEVVLAVTSAGRAVGATLGNDVNLRDFEGRSALLLTEAKDNNSSCAIGPLIRLFDEDFGLDQVRSLDVDLTVTGVDGFVLRERSSMSAMSRTLQELVGHAVGPHHRYPDGFVLFTGTMFAPTQDRDHPGMGFTHHLGDQVQITTPALGTLINTVTTAEDAPDWTVGIRALIANLAARGLVGTHDDSRSLR